MTEAKVKAHLINILDELGYDFSKFTIDGFAEWIAAWRGRPIEMVRIPLPPDMFGAWIKSERTDYIFYDDGPFRVHSIHILLHELSHVLLNHKTIHVDANVDILLHHYLRSLDTDGSLATLVTLQGLCRTLKYTDQQELEAETLSSLTQARVFHLAGLDALTQPSQTPVMHAMVEGLGFDR